MATVAVLASVTLPDGKDVCGAGRNLAEKARFSPRGVPRQVVYTSTLSPAAGRKFDPAARSRVRPRLTALPYG